MVTVAFFSWRGRRPVHLFVLRPVASQRSRWATYRRLW